MQDGTAEKRNIGLDVARTIAISLVLLSHSIYIFSFKSGIFTNRYWHFEVFGYLGVELFFVLSGFLIGRILLHNILCNDGQWGKRLLNFYARRWFRTLPLYYLVLVLNVFFWSNISFWDFAGNRYINWRHFLFLQNYQAEVSNFFPESWSLAVEEWFYLLLPLLLVITVSNTNNQRKVKLVGLMLLGFIIIILLTRMVFVWSNEPSFDFGIRKNIFIRLDSLTVGVLIAYIEKNKPQVFKKLASMQYAVIAIAALLVIIAYFWLVGWAGWDRSFFARTIMLDIVSVSFAIVIIWLYHRQFKYSSIFTSVSTLAYSLYLIHLPVFVYASYWSAQFDNFSISVLLYVLSIGAIYSTAHFLYRYYEKPIMDYRPPSL